jgi:tetratricopeptide (TPR) repeat protein/O-antigen ligase
MAKAVKRRSVWSDSEKVQARRPARPPARAWSPVLGEAVILALVVAVPIVINTRSQVLTDVKDAVLGLGAALGIALWLVVGLAQRRLSWVRTPLLPLSLVYLLWAFISVFYSGYPAVVIGEVGRLAAGIALFVLTVLAIRGLPQVRRIIGAACLASVPVSIYAFAQHAGHDFIAWSHTTSSGRVFSFLGNPTYLAGFVMLNVPVAVAAMWSRPRARTAAATLLWWLSLGFVIVSAAMMLLAAYFSFTIAVAIGLGLGAAFAFVLAVLHGGRKAIGIAAVALVAGAVVIALTAPAVYRHMPPGQQRRVQRVIHFQDPYAAERQLHWRTAFRLFGQSPVFGKGYGAFRIYSLEQMTTEWYAQQQARESQMLMPGYAHNEYLQVLADTGAVGGLLFFALLVMLYVTIIRVALRHPEAQWRRIALGLAAAVTAFLFQNLVGVTFRQSGASMFFWLWTGVAAVGATSLPHEEGALGRAPVAEWHGGRRSWPALIAAAAGTAAVLAALAWVSITPLVANMRVRLARALAADEHYREAIAVCDGALDLCPTSYLAQYVKAFAAGKIGDYEAAAKANEQALKLGPGNASAYYNLGVSYKELHKYPEAEKAFREAIRLMPIKQHYASLAETLFYAGRLDEAEQEARRTMEMDPPDRETPGNDRVKALLANIQATRGGRAMRAPRTVDDLRAALKDLPRNVALQSQLTVALIQQKRYREGLAEAQRWAQWDPTSGEAHRAVGVCAFSIGDFATAKQAFQRQKELQPTNLKARLNLAFCCVKLHDYEAALVEFRYVAEHGGDSEEGKEARRVLAKVQPSAQPRSSRPSR